MGDLTFNGVPFTFILGVLAMLLTFWGVAINLFPADVFTDVLYAVMGTYGVTSVARKVSGAIQSRAGTVPPAAPTDGGAG